MEIIQLPKGGGKTTRLLMKVIDTSGILVVASNQHRGFALEQAVAQFPQMSRPWWDAHIKSVGSSLGGLYGPFFADNLEEVLMYAVGKRFDTATLSGPAPAPYVHPALIGIDDDGSEENLPAAHPF